jgi:hypothetical protein
MKLASRIVLAVLAVAGLAGPGPAARPAVAAQEGPPAASPGPSPAPSEGVPREDPLEEFVPREKVPADSAVSFPVDI